MVALIGCPCEHARRLRRDLHRVLRLLVILDREVRAIDVAVAQLDGEGVRAELGIGWDRVVPVRRAHVGELHRLRPHHLVGLRIAHLQAEFLALRNRVTARGLRAHDGLEVHRVAGPIYRTIGVGVALHRAIGIAADVPRARRVDGKLLGVDRQHRDVLRLGCGDGRVDQALLIGGLRGNFLLIDPDLDRNAGDRIAAAAIDDEGHQAAGAGFGDDGDVGDDDDGVGAQLAVGGFDQVDALVADGHGRRNAFPLLMRRNGPLPHGDDLLLIQHRDLREAFDLRAFGLLGFAHLPEANFVARVRRELRADEVANPRPDAMLPRVEFLQPGVRLFRHRRTLSAEVVQLLHLAEELHRIVHAIDAELELLHVVRVDGDLRLLAGKEGLLAGEREPGFGIGVLGKQRQDQEVEEKQNDDGAVKTARVVRTFRSAYARAPIITSRLQPATR